MGLDRPQKRTFVVERRLVLLSLSEVEQESSRTPKPFNRISRHHQSHDSLRYSVISELQSTADSSGQLGGDWEIVWFESGFDKTMSRLGIGLRQRHECYPNGMGAARKSFRGDRSRGSASPGRPGDGG